jgi:hypothetical protein
LDVSGWWWWWWWWWRGTHKKQKLKIDEDIKTLFNGTNTQLSSFSLSLSILFLSFFKYLEFTPRHRHQVLRLEIE